MTDQRSVGIVGCGDMGTAIAHRLVQSGYNVVIGSRNPAGRKYLNFEVRSIPECISRSSIIIVAIHAEHYTNALISPLEHNSILFDGKILIDISNQTEKKSDDDNLSNAERLQLAIPKAHVVKAFNTVSSYFMQNTAAGESGTIAVASDNPAARDKIIMLARDMGFEPYNGGSLQISRQLESSTKQLFPLWKGPILTALAVLLFWSLYMTYMKFISTKEISWHQVFLHITNKVLCTSAITMLALVYMPSNLACLFQLIYGTKEKRFPAWLDKWLLSRKQLGLLTFAIALFHALTTLVLMSPAYYTSWFHSSTVTVTPIKNTTVLVVRQGLMTWKGELASLMGILTLLTLSLLAIASIPALGNLLNWREWRFIQSKLGTFALILAIGHVFAMAAPRWIDRGFVKSLQSVGVHCVFFPVLTILLKFFFCLPCLSGRIARIRRGEQSQRAQQVA